MHIAKRVTFDMPNGFTKEFFAADMHFHTKYSDTYTRIKPILKLARKKNIHLAITDHNEVQGCLEASQNKYGVKIIPGIEVGCKEGPHLLLYFYSVKDLQEFFEKHIKPFRHKNPNQNTKVKVKDLLEQAKKYPCIVSVAHPTAPNYFNWMRCVKENGHADIFKYIDAMEVICGQSLRKMNEKAIALCQQFGKGFTAGSDGHFLHALGTTITYASADSVEGFLGAIQQKQNFVMGKELSLLPRLYHLSRVSAKHTQYPVGTLEFYYRHYAAHLKTRLGLSGK